MAQTCRGEAAGGGLPSGFAEAVERCKPDHMRYYDTAQEGSAPQAGGEAPALGREAKTLDPAGRGRRRRRHQLLDIAAKLRPGERVAGCQRRAAGSAVAAVLRGGRAGFTGIQTCSNVWLCPVCAPKIMRKRENELKKLMKWARALGYSSIMMTLTARHKYHSALSAQLESLQKAKTRMHQSRGWRAIKDEIVGHIRVLENTCSKKNGHHPHFHILIICKNEEAEAKRMIDGLRADWQWALQKEGLDCNDHGFDCRAGDAIEKYIAKWGIEAEMAGGAAKAAAKRPGAGRSPWDLLAIAGGAEGTEFSRAEAARRWDEYACATKGRNLMAWSPGLKALAGIQEIGDEEAAAAEEAGLCHPEADEIGRMSAAEFKAVARAGLRIKMLEEIEAGGRAGFEAVLQEALGAAIRRRAGPD